eukprot:scaffold17_cov83-Cylindrotheca_fusiformis.AAC.1
MTKKSIKSSSSSSAASVSSLGGGIADDDVTISTVASSSFSSMSEAGCVVLSDFDIQSILRTDPFGPFHVLKVRTGRNKKKKCVALKCLKRKSGDLLELKEGSDQLQQEATLLESLNHPNIVKATGLPGGQSPHGYFLAYELIEETLEDRLKVWSSAESSNSHGLLSMRKRMNRCEREQFFYDRVDKTMVGICSALMYLHGRQILHPLRPDCIGFDKRHGKVKMFDFGLYEQVTPNRMRYMSPEYIQTGTGSFASDVYSFGVLLWQVSTLKEPFEFMMKENDEANHMDISAILNKLVHKNWRPETTRRSIPDEKIRRLIKDCWHSNPDARPTITRISFILLECLSKQYYGVHKKSTRRS